jgi:hypothetical protein
LVDHPDSEPLTMLKCELTTLDRPHYVPRCEAWVITLAAARLDALATDSDILGCPRQLRQDWSREYSENGDRARVGTMP